MRRLKKRLLSIFAAAAISICSLPQDTSSLLSRAIIACAVTDDTPEIIENGSCGENLAWTLDSNGTLTITGSGLMDNTPNLADMEIQL